MKGLNSTIKDYVIFSTFFRKDWNEIVCEDFIAKIHVYPTDFLLNLRSCFKFIPRQIETYVEADWSPRQGLNMAGTYLLAMIILFLNKFKNNFLIIKGLFSFCGYGESTVFYK